MVENNNTSILPVMSLLTVPDMPVELSDKHVEKLSVDNEAREDLNLEKEKALEKSLLLKEELEARIENEKRLKEENKELALKIEKLIAIAEEASKKIDEEDKESNAELQTLISIKENLEENLTLELEKEKKLKANNDELAMKISELLAIAEDATLAVEAEHNVTEVKIQGLLSQKDNLEKNVTHLKTVNSELGSKISDLLLIAQEGVEKAEAENNVTLSEMQALLSSKNILEGNVTTLQNTNNELGAKISELLTLAEEGTLKAEAEHNATVKEIEALNSAKAKLETDVATLKETNSELGKKISDLLLIAEDGVTKAEAAYAKEQQEIQGLLTIKESLEENLTLTENNDKKLLEDNKALQAKISELLTLTEEATAKQEAEEKKIASLLTEENTLKVTNQELAKKITDLLSIAEEGTAKAEKVFASEKQSLLETQENLKHLEEEKSTLTARISELLASEKEKTEKVKLEETKIQGLLSTKESLESNLTAELEKEKLLAEENAKLKEKLLQSQKAEEEAKLAAEKAEAERLAMEEEVKAKEKAEAERLAAEKAAAEKAAAEKAEAERLAAEKAKAAALEAEKNLSDAFALTNVQFKTGSAQLTSESKKRLKVAVDVMKRYEGYAYKIQGHTDNRGNENFNIKLSAQRAKAVKDYLVSQGIDKDILSTEGLGSSQPIASNDTKEGRLKNRRVVFKIIK